MYTSIESQEHATDNVTRQTSGHVPYGGHYRNEITVA